MHSTKRKRNNAPCLNRPFRSPLHVSSHEQAQSTALSKKVDDPAQEPDVIAPTLTTTPSNLPLISTLPPSLPVIAASSDSSPPSVRQRISTNRRIVSSPIRYSPRHIVPDTYYISLQKQHSALTLQLKHISTDLDTVAQACKIASTTTDSELTNLVTKWRSVARDAAEELFAVAKDKVNRMGGVGAWRDKFDRKPNGGDSNDWGRGDGVDEDDLTSEQKEQLEIARDDARREAEKYGLLDEASQKPVKVNRDDDTFSIDMMLKQLNVDLDLIGYDVQAQRWTD